MRKKLFLILLCMIFTISGVCFVFAADTTFTSVTLDGTKTEDGIYKSAVTVKYNITDAEGIKEVRLFLGDKKVLTADYSKDGDGNLLTELNTTIDASQKLSKQILAENETEKSEYVLTMKVIDGNNNVSTKEVKFKADVLAPKLSIKDVVEENYYPESKELKVEVKDPNLKGAKLRILVEELEYGEDENAEPTKKEYLKKIDLDATEENTFKIEKEGNYIITLSCTDTVDNKATKSFFYYVDTKAPEFLDFSLGGSFGESGWYNADEDIKIISDITDDFSGLKNAKIYINGDLYKEVKLTETEKITKCTACGGEVSSMSEELREQHDKMHKDEDVIFFLYEYERCASIVDEAKLEDYPITKKWLAENASDDGKYAIKIVIEDNAGNKAEKETSFFADSVPPNVSFSGISNGDIVKTAPKVTAKSDDKYAENGKIILEVYTGDSSDPYATREANGPSVYFDAFNKDGIYSLMAQAYDYAGNPSPPAELLFTLDTKAPKIENLMLSGHSKADGLWYDGAVEVSTSMSDATTTIENVTVAVNGKEIFNEKIGSELYERNWEIADEWLIANPSEDGKYTVEITATDAAGNSSTKSASFYADLTDPTVTISGITEGEVTNKKPTITATSGDAYSGKGKVKMVITRDGELYKEVSKNGAKCTFNDFEDDGRYVIKATATDAAGNVSETATKSFIYDTTAPTVDPVNLSGEKNPGFNWYKGAVTISGHAAEALSGLDSIIILAGSETMQKEVMVDDTFTADFSKVFDADWIKANETFGGKYVLTVKVKDKAGNIATVQKSFYADVSAPTVELKGIKDGEFTNESPRLSATVEDNYKITNTIYFDIDKDGKDFKEVSKKGSTMSFDEFTEDGVYVITVKAVDMAGNTSAEQKVSFTKDTVAPIVTLSGAKEGSFSKGDKTVTVTIKEKNYKNVKVVASMEKTLEHNRKTLGFAGIVPDKEVYTKSKKVSETGTYTTIVSVTDAAGNRSERAKLTFTIDKEKPVIDIRNVAKENGHTARITPKVTYKDSYFKDVKISLTRADGKAFNVKYSDTKNATGGARNYSNFEKVKKNDGLYTLTCTVVDKAGNTATKKMEFAVNRFGSKYKLPKATKELNNAYVQKLEEDLVIIEKNVTGLKEYQVTVTKDGIQRDVAVKLAIGQEKGWKTYQYTISKDLFKEEGVYTVNVTSKDTVGNFNEFQEKVKTGFRLYVDNTPPTISVDNIESGKSYKGDKSIAIVNVNDAIHLSWYTVYSNNKQIFASSQDEFLQNSREVVIPAGVKQDVKIVAGDSAGNIEELVIEDVTVSDNFFVRLWTHKFLCILLALAIVGGAVGGTIFIKKRRANAEDFEEDIE